MHSKKAQQSGEMSLLNLAILLASIGLGIVMFYYVVSNADNTIFWQNFYAKDVALTMDSMLGVPGEVDLFYKIRNDNYRFEYEIKDGIVTIYLPSRNNPITFHFAKKETMPVPMPYSFFQSFPLKKTSTELVFEEQPQQQACEIIGTTDSHYKNKYFFFESLTDDAQSRASLAKLVTEQRAESNAKLKITDLEGYATLWVYYSQTNEDKTTIYYSYDKIRSTKLACLVHKRLASQDESRIIEKKYVVPAQGAFAELEKQPAIQIVLGKDMESDLVAIAVVDAIEDYYE